MLSRFIKYLASEYSGGATKVLSKAAFCLHINRQGALADGLHGLNPINTGLGYTPKPSD
jgi:hypothetical protein